MWKIRRSGAHKSTATFLSPASTGDDMVCKGSRTQAGHHCETPCEPGIWLSCCSNWLGVSQYASRMICEAENAKAKTAVPAAIITTARLLPSANLFQKGIAAAKITGHTIELIVSQRQGNCVC